MVDKKRWRCLLDESLIALILILILTKEELTTDDLNKISQSIFHAFYVLFPSIIFSQKIGGSAAITGACIVLFFYFVFSVIFYCLISSQLLLSTQAGG